MKKMQLFLSGAVLLALCLAPGVLLATATPGHSPYGEAPPPPLQARLQAAAEGNLLVNGGMDDLPFYKMYPNHHVAGAWNRWWIHLTVLPEYDDTRLARPNHEGGHAQVYFKYFGKGEEYHAGIYQVVENLTPCVPYRFTMYARNHTLDVVKPRARIGLDPLGTQLTSEPKEGAVLSLPASVVWSAEQVNLFVWEQLAVVAEPPGTRLTAITYAHPQLPEEGGPLAYYADTYWDTGRLEQIPFANGRLPASPSAVPTDFISAPGVSASGNNVNVQWTLTAAAPTQVWYRLLPPSPAPPVGDLPYKAFLPMIRHSMTPAGYTQVTPMQVSQQTQYQATISDVPSGYTVQGLVVARRPVQGACTTQVSAPFSVTIP